MSFVLLSLIVVVILADLLGMPVVLTYCRLIKKFT